MEELPSTQRLASRGRSTRTASLDVTAPEPVLVPVPTRAKRVVKEEIEEQILPSGLSTRTRSSPQDRGQSSRESQAPKQPETAISPEPAPAPISAPPQTDGGDVFDLALPRIQAILDRLAEGKKGIQLSTLVNKIYFEHKFPNFKNGQSGSHRIPVEEFLHYNAKELLNNLDQVKYGDKDFYAWLQEKAGTKFSPIAIKPSDFPYPLIPRSKLSTPRVNQKDQGVAGTNHALSSLENEDDFGSSTYDHSQSPRAGKSMKTPGRYPKKSSLRLSSKKRPHSDIDDSESDSGSGAKKSHFFQDEDESMEDAGDANSNHEGDGTVQIVIQADKLPSTTPQGLHGTWTCDQEDCDYIVRGGDSAECEARIQRHFQDHERRMELVQLAMTEGNRGHVQIKYAYFPPFLILVHMNSNTNTNNMPNPPSIQPRTSGTSGFPSPPQDHDDFRDHVRQFRSDAVLSKSPSGSSSALPLPGATKANFRSLVNQFRRKPHTVSDRIHRLTTSQQPSREDQEAGRAATATTTNAERRRRSQAYQNESDSLTERE